jgi:hypothetical protein
MIVLAVLHVVAVGFILRTLDRRQKAGQRLREHAHFQRSTGLLL